MPAIRTIARPIRHEIPKIRGSRFIASVAGADSADTAMAFVDALREEFRDATHNCFAWRLADDESRAGDAGEPSGTAGRPILREIDGRDLVRVVVVVTRYYGGTKLGTGGLTRAYGAAAAEVLDLAGAVQARVTTSLRVTYSYDFSGAVSSVLASAGLELGETKYAADIQGALAVPVEDVEQMARALRDATNGRIRIEFIEGR